MNYEVNLKKVSIQMFYKYLSKKALFKSHQILKKDLLMYEKTFLDMGIKTLDILYNNIKTQSKVKKLAENHGLDLEYITILRRHIMSFVSKSRNLSELSTLPEEQKQLLYEYGIYNTKQLYENYSITKRLDLNHKFLYGMKELTRLRYVSSRFAEGIYLAGYESVQELANALPEEVRMNINKTSQDLNLFRVKIGKSDSVFLVEDAKLYLSWFL